MSIVAQNHVYTSGQSSLIQGIDLTINKGQKVALVGNNGSENLPSSVSWLEPCKRRKGDYLSDPTLLRTPAFRAI